MSWEAWEITLVPASCVLSVALFCGCVGVLMGIVAARQYWLRKAREDRREFVLGKSTAFVAGRN